MSYADERKEFRRLMGHPMNFPTNIWDEYVELRTQVAGWETELTEQEFKDTFNKAKDAYHLKVQIKEDRWRAIRAKIASRS